VEAAESYAWPRTSGTLTGRGPDETLIRTRVPTLTRSPGFGSCASTMFGSLLDGTSCTSYFRFAAFSAATASSRLFPRTSGTVVFATPVETQISTKLPLSIRSPAAGSWRNTIVFGYREFGSRWMCEESMRSPALRMFSTACSSRSWMTSGTPTGLFAFSSSWIWL
jgi:hypothetical protein